MVKEYPSRLHKYAGKNTATQKGTQHVHEH